MLISFARLCAAYLFVALLLHGAFCPIIILVRFSNCIDAKSAVWRFIQTILTCFAPLQWVRIHVKVNIDGSYRMH
jgi:succinylarginine dihydrolase